MLWNNIGWCPCYNDDCDNCQNVSFVKSEQTAVIVDGFDIANSTIQSLTNSNHKVICYFSGGTWENWRSDKNDFKIYTKRAKMGDWDGEWWLNLYNETSVDAIKPIMERRMNLAKAKGCHAIEWDNVDCWANSECRLGYNLSNAK